MYKEHTYRFSRRWIYVAACAAVVVLLLVVLIGPVSRRAGQAIAEQSAASVKDAVMKSAVQCYAVEGTYPNSLAYLEDHYGLVINHDRFIVSYEAFASNLTPNVKVLVRGDADGDSRRDSQGDSQGEEILP